MSRREDLPARLRRVRMERGLTLRETARRAKISSAYLCRIEHRVDRSPPSEAVLARLAKVLEDDVDRLLHMAGRVPEDVYCYILKTPGLVKFLREAKAAGLTGEDLLKLLNESHPVGARP